MLPSGINDTMNTMEITMNIKNQKQLLFILKFDILILCFPIYHGKHHNITLNMILSILHSFIVCMNTWWKFQQNRKKKEKEKEKKTKI
jgi:hypothetical protein